MFSRLFGHLYQSCQYRQGARQTLSTVGWTTVMTTTTMMKNPPIRAMPLIWKPPLSRGARSDRSLERDTELPHHHRIDGGPPMTLLRGFDLWIGTPIPVMTSCHGPVLRRGQAEAIKPYHSLGHQPCTLNPLIDIVCWMRSELRL